MRRLLPLLILLALLPSAPALHLEASTARSEFLAGERFTVQAYLFNDGDESTTGSITIDAPPGFAPLSDAQASGAIPAGGVLSLSSSYQVAGAAVGLHTFVVRGGGQIVAVVIRVGPVRAPPARVPRWRVYLPAFL